MKHYTCAHCGTLYTGSPWYACGVPCCSRNCMRDELAEIKARQQREQDKRDYEEDLATTRAQDLIEKEQNV